MSLCRPYMHTHINASTRVQNLENKLVQTDAKVWRPFPYYEPEVMLDPQMLLCGLAPFRKQEEGPILVRTLVWEVSRVMCH